MLNHSRTVTLLGRHSGGKLTESGLIITLRRRDHKMYRSLAIRRAGNCIGQVDLPEKGMNDEVSSSKDED